MSAMKHEELVQLLQEGKIGHLRFVMEGDNAREYLEWCRSLWHLELIPRPYPATQDRRHSTDLPG